MYLRWILWILLFRTNPLAMLLVATLFAVLCACVAQTTCHAQINEYQCEHDAGCFWCTLNQGSSYTCYTTKEAEALSGASCSKPLPGPTPPPAPPAPTPAPPAPTPGPPVPTPGPPVPTPGPTSACFAITVRYSVDRQSRAIHMNIIAQFMSTNCRVVQLHCCCAAAIGKVWRQLLCS